MAVLKHNEANFVEAVEAALREHRKQDKRSTTALANSFGIEDKTEIKELTELAIVNTARGIACSDDNPGDKFQRIVQLYNEQVILSHRTSQSILLQQYSTPAPIGYLMGLFCGLPDLPKDQYAFEPSAGNGLLTIAGDPSQFIVNEIDKTRNRNLGVEGFFKVMSSDASQPFEMPGKKFKAVLTNPPFGILDNIVKYGNYPINTLDHLMSLRALDTMDDDGRAAIIIGGYSKWDSLGRLTKKKNRFYFNYLYHHYHVMDVIPIDGRYLYTRQGTGIPVRLILIAGRKKPPAGAAPLKADQDTTIIKTFDALYDRVRQAMDLAKVLPSENIKSTMNIQDLAKRARELAERLKTNDELGALYLPGSSGTSLNTEVPDAMSFEMQTALNKIKTEIGGDMDNFVRHRLQYATINALYQVLSAEQIDAVAMAIYNIEARGQGIIIGDQTGIGKGRVAAAMIRYGVKRGVKPIFLTEKASLFSSLYRDLVAIGSGHLRPFIINSKEDKTEIKDENGETIYEALGPAEQHAIFESAEVPRWFDFVVATYSQFNSPKRPVKSIYLSQIARQNILVLDESHNASGSGNTAGFMQSVVRDTLGVVFLSATFAKRPANMPIYAMKTVIQEANMGMEGLVSAINSGGVALQEILSSQLVQEGQMIRRERGYEGIEVNYVQLDSYEDAHRATSDSITKILRDIIAFQENYVDPEVKKMDQAVSAAGKQVAKRGGTNKAGVDNLPYFSKVFNVINQMLFSIKAGAVADRAIQRLKEGKKPVIAFASTMGAFVEQMTNEDGQPVGDGDSIRLDFSEVLRKGLDGVLRYTVYDSDGEKTFETYDPKDLGMDAYYEYERIVREINSASTGVTISPIDLVIEKLERAGYSVAEVTGRKYSVIREGDMGIVTSRKKITANDAFRRFNNNEIDVLMINQSGSTGESAHAIVTSKVPRDEVKQRVMLVLQAELDINIEVQKRGRINRTGQIYKPIYDYVTSAIPAEKRLMMMLQEKLKSLDANTTSNQKQSSTILDVPDFLNKYGDRLVKEYLQENPSIDRLLGRPLMSESQEEDGVERYIPDAAHKVSGRVAVLSTKMQLEFYNEMTERYNDYIEYLKQCGDYDLEVETLDLKAETMESNIIIMGKGGDSAFGEDSTIEQVKVNVLKKPFKAIEVEHLMNEVLGGRTAEAIKADMLEDLSIDFKLKIQQEIQEINSHYDNQLRDIPNERKIKKLVEDQQAYSKAVDDRKQEIEELRSNELRDVKGGKSSREQYIHGLIDFFSIGRKLAYPLAPGQTDDTALAICLGVVIDKKRKNPYARSAIKIRLVVANSLRQVSIPGTREDVISAILLRSTVLKTPEKGELLTDWEAEIRSRVKDRSIRYMVTGNILQAIAEEKGRLVAYTTTDGEVKKGILLPEEYKLKDLSKRTTVVPIIKCLKLLGGLVQGNMLKASESLSFIRTANGYQLILPAARSKGGTIYMDSEIWPLITNNKFELASDKMKAELPEANLEALVTLLQQRHSVNMELNMAQLSLVDKKLRLNSKRNLILLPPQGNDEEIERVRILSLKAKALELKLKLKRAA